MLAQNTERANLVRVCLFVTQLKKKNENEVWRAKTAKETRFHSEWRVKSSKSAWLPPLPPVGWVISIEFYVLPRCELGVNALNLLAVWDSVWKRVCNATSKLWEARITRRISRQERVESRAVGWICEWKWAIRVGTQRMWTNRLRMCLWMKECVANSHSNWHHNCLQTRRERQRMHFSRSTKQTQSGNRETCSWFMGVMIKWFKNSHSNSMKPSFSNRIKHVFIVSTEQSNSCSHSPYFTQLYGVSFTWLAMKRFTAVNST